MLQGHSGTALGNEQQRQSKKKKTLLCDKTFFVTGVASQKLALRTTKFYELLQ